MYDFIEARSASGMGPYSPIKPFGKNSAWAGVFVAEEPPCLQSYFGAPVRHREIGDLTQILAMNTASHRAAKRARTRSRRRPERHGDPLYANLDIFDGENPPEQVLRLEARAWP